MPRISKSYRAIPEESIHQVLICGTIITVRFPDKSSCHDDIREDAMVMKTSGQVYQNRLDQIEHMLNNGVRMRKMKDGRFMVNPFIIQTEHILDIASHLVLKNPNA